ncbi:MAG: GNAT family N-acetyltransferase [Chloroflexota bacterium]
MRTMEYRIIESLREFELATDLEIAVWGLNPRDAVPVNLMRALHHAGGVMIGAYDGAPLVGIAFAFPARMEDRVILWSHMTGIRHDYQGQGVGFELKLRQREWALANGYDQIGWTFDPLQRGNANFNLHCLGATSGSYHENFYGFMEDEINHAGLPSDRVEALWHLHDPHVVQRAAGIFPAEALMNPPFLLRDQGTPLVTALDQTQSEYLVQIPRTLSAMDDQAVLRWRLALREALTSAFASGCVAVDFTANNAYLLRRLY